MIICGIDYGSKLAGTTVVAWVDSLTKSIHLASSQKKADADLFIHSALLKLNPAAVFIDAPLSLPGVYTHLANCHDYFFRESDKQLHAMSPMFLGGLTARAMKLKKELEALYIPMYETYPAAQAIRLGLLELGYKKNPVAIPAIVGLLEHHLAPYILEDIPVTTWHQVDALLALLAGLRFMNKQHKVVGNEVEGVIIV
jgi:predicted nuclease with RNAse H fold